MEGRDDRLEPFGEEVRDFLRTRLTDDLRAAARYTIGTHSHIAASREWHRRLYEKGWVAPHWPAEHGGTGWSVAERRLFDRECALNEAPILFAGGLRSLGPLLIELGSREQQKKYLPPILTGEHLWCQGFSEPAAGSDLAALQIKAVRDGDEYVLDGTKIWTTGAHLSTHMFCLVRTSKHDKPQQGITFLMIDMKTPGLTVEPIQLINGEHEFNQVFFDGVRVSVCDRVGDEDDGWRVAKILMGHARSSNTTTVHLQRSLSALRRMASDAHVEPALAQKIDGLNIRLSAFDALETRCRAADSVQGARGPTVSAPSMLKTLATELHQDITEIGMLLAGMNAVEQHAPYAFRQGTNDWEMERDTNWATAKYLGMRAASIYSGTSEVHRNLLARSLGLPQ